MSRGFRGGRGRGGFGRGGPMGMMGRGEKGEAGREPPKHAGMLYPPLDDNALPVLPGPTDEEDRIFRYSLELREALEKGVEIPTMGAPGERSAPWRIEGGRKVVGIEIEQTRYSDRWDDPLNVRPSSLLSARPSSANFPAGQTSTPGASGSRLNPSAMYMDQSMFPGCLWKGYFEDEGVDKGVKRLEKRRKRDPDEDSVPDGAAEDDDQGSARSSDPEEDFDFDDDEEDHQDYDHNYFDNGEGDDDEGGDDEDEGAGGGFDD